jgi:outer membrane protein assembly factor BamA
VQKLSFNLASIAIAIAVGLARCHAQLPPASQTYPSHLPYGFSNLVWWSDTELRSILKQRIKGLGVEIVPDSPALAQIRNTLKSLLQQKGIDADIQSEEPSTFSLTAQRDQDSPGPAIVFRLISPKVLVERVVIIGAPEKVKDDMTSDLHSLEGREYAGEEWVVRSSARRTLEPKGYLSPHVEVTHDSPRRSGDRYLVNVLISMDVGVQYRLASISAGGGPLLEGRDLSEYFSKKAGDIAGSDPFRMLAGSIQTLYQHYGFADVLVEDPPQLDPTHATVSYRLTVTPGPLYHVRNLTIQNLDAEQESKVRDLLEMKSGDVYDQSHLTELYRKIANEPALSSLKFGYKFKEDAAASAVDLSLDFYKEGGAVKATVQ